MQERPHLVLHFQQQHGAVVARGGACPATQNDEARARAGLAGGNHNLRTDLQVGIDELVERVIHHAFRRLLDGQHAIVRLLGGHAGEDALRGRHGHVAHAVAELAGRHLM